MDLEALTKEELQEIPMVEIAFEIMAKRGEPLNYYDLFQEISTLKRLTKAEEEMRIAKLYTDINIDGRFHSLGNNEWGLRKWYPLDKANEEITTPARQKQEKEMQEVEVNFDEFEEKYGDLEAALDEVEEDNEQEYSEEDFEAYSDLEAELEEEELN